MIADLAVLAVVSVAAFRGWRRGMTLTALALVGLAGGYVCALVLARPIGGAIARAGSVPLIVALPIAGMVVLGVVSLAAKLITRRIETERRLKRTSGWVPSRADSAGGAALAALAAGAVAVVVVSLIAAAQGLATGGTSPLAGSLAARLGSPLTRSLVYLGARGATREPLTATVLASIAADPARGVRALQTVTQDRRVQALWNEPSLREALIRQDAGAVAANPTVRELASDPRFRTAAEQLGLVRTGGGALALGSVLATRLGPLLRSVESARNDPELRQMLDDPELRSRLASGDVRSILVDPRFNRITERILGGVGR